MKHSKFPDTLPADALAPPAAADDTAILFTPVPRLRARLRENHRE